MLTAVVRPLTLSYMSVTLTVLTVLFALGVGYVIGRFHMTSVLAPAKDRAENERDLLRKQLDQESERLKEIRAEFEDSFAALAAKALSTANAEFRKQAGEQFKALAQQSSRQLDTKKELIDAHLKEMGTTLKGLNEKSTQLTERLKNNQDEMKNLRSTTDKLRNVLSSSQQRGQWGERMVEDILGALGLVKGLNYTTQTTDTSGTRPDFTFILPKNKTVNLDVKFPIDDYKRYVEAEGEVEAQAARKDFLQAVKGHLKDVAGRGYVDPAGGTVDYVMVFIPNESIYAFIHQSDPGILDYALAKRIVLCSPITLYAVLSLMRQSVESFHLEEQASEIMNVLGEFRQQWQKYVDQMDTVDKRLDSVRTALDELRGVRTRQLDKRVERIDLLQSGIDRQESLTPPGDD